MKIINWVKNLLFKEKKEDLDMVRRKYAKKTIRQLKMQRERCRREYGSQSKCYREASSAIANKKMKTRKKRSWWQW